MKILVTGATGFIGSHLSEQLVKDGHDVIIHFSSRRSGRSWRISKELWTKSDYVCFDVRDRRSVINIIDYISPDVVYHLANAGIYGGVSVDEDESISINLQGGYNVAYASKCVGSMFINVGSSSEYGDQCYPMEEDFSVPRPETPYAIAKTMVTHYTYMMSLEGHKCATFRIFSPYGPKDDDCRLIPSVIKSIIKNEEITIQNSNVTRDYVYIDDVVDVLVKAPGVFDKISNMSTNIFNIGTGYESLIFWVVETIADIMGYSKKIIYKEPPAVVNTRWVADTSKLNIIMPERKQTTLREGLKQTIHYYMEQIN